MSGFIFVVEHPERIDRIQEYIETDPFAGFSDVINSFDWKQTEPDLCLISFDGESITHAALVRRGNKVANYIYRLVFRPIFAIHPIPFAKLQENLDPSLHRHLSFNSGRVAPSVWPQLWDAVRKLCPNDLDHLDMLARTKNDLERRFDNEAYDIVAMERDAVGLALDVFGAPRAYLETWTSGEENQPAPFLQGLTEVSIREDPMIFQDASTAFPGWELDRRNVIGAVEFRRYGEKLTVMNANRLRIEETLGVDLLYYHSKYKTYVFVQYKRMTGYPVEYRRDGSYDDELRRMNEVAVCLSSTGTCATANDYRLNRGAFYWKLCPADKLNPMSTDLVKGMYLPLDFWNVLISSNQIIGPRGGITVRFDNVGRHINNTMFIKLLQDGWIGSPVEDEKLLSDIIQNAITNSLENGNSAMIAVSEPDNG